MKCRDRENVGQIHDAGNGTHIWQLPDYHVFSYYDRYCLKSPWFSYSGEEWQLVVMPTYQGNFHEGKGGDVGLFLWKKLSNFNYEYSVVIGVKTIDGSGTDKVERGKINSGNGFGTWKLLEDISAPHSEFRSCGLIHFFCTVERIENQPEENLLTNVEESKNDIEIETDEDKKNGSEAKDVEGSKNENDKMNGSEAKGVDRLLQNLKGIFGDEQNSDVTLKVDNQEFHVHWVILAARCPVLEREMRKELEKNLVEQDSDWILKKGTREFSLDRGIIDATSLIKENTSDVFGIPNSVAECDSDVILQAGDHGEHSPTRVFKLVVKEKTRGVVDINDWAAESFKAFLLYLYTGAIETMSSDNVLSLYHIADKYCVDDLKEECVQFMKENISVENICDIALFLGHSETGLLEEATDFFCQNCEEIIETPKWVAYLKENTEHANELIKKILKERKQKA